MHAATKTEEDVDEVDLTLVSRGPSAVTPCYRRQLPVSILSTSSSATRCPGQPGAQGQGRAIYHVRPYLSPAGPAGPRSRSLDRTGHPGQSFVRRRHLLGTSPINRRHELLPPTSRPASVFLACCIYQPQPLWWAPKWRRFIQTPGEL